MDTPPVRSTVRNRYGFQAVVAEVFMGSGAPAMILDWTDSDGRKRGQVFTCRDWRDSWEVMQHARNSKKHAGQS